MIRGSDMENLDEYKKLYTHLCGLQVKEWETTFGEIESIIGFRLPDFARKDRGWWANKKLVKGLMITSLWIEAGWKTAEVDMEAEKLVFVKLNGPEDIPKFNLDEIWPPISVGEWPEGLSLRREDMYEDRI